MHKNCSLCLLCFFFQIIPNEFLQYFRGKIPRTIKLQLRDGCTYDVQVTKNLGKISLQSGWKAFVTAHDLQMGDFLVFSYDGISKLKVLIFGPSGCEKVHSRPTLKNATHCGEKWEEPLHISSNSHDLPVKSPQNVSKSEKQWDSSEQENDTANIGLSISLPSHQAIYLIVSQCQRPTVVVIVHLDFTGRFYDFFSPF